MLRAILFDLDDTLYRELDFVASGFDAVASTAASSLAIEARSVRAALDAALATHGRGHTIEHALVALGIDHDRIARLLPTLVRAYRSHQPELVLLPDAARCLEAATAAGIVMGLVTDGDPTVQRAKVRALGLCGRFVVERYTWDAGPTREKPHASAYAPALDALTSRGICADEAVYVGDNPAKDFVGARALGLRTMRVRRGPHAASSVPSSLDADETVESLDVLTSRVQAASRVCARAASARATRTAP